MDFDGEGAQLDAVRLADTLALLGVPCYLERSRSGKGMHCWVFFKSPVPAHRARLLGKQIVQRVGLPRSFDRFFPSQDFHSGKGVGNLIALPLQGESQKEGNTVFLDARTLTPHLCQWTVLRDLQRLSADDLDSAILESKADLQFLPLPLVRKTRQEPCPPELSGKLRVVLAEHLEVLGPYPPAIQQFLREHSRFANPEWFRRQRIGASLPLLQNSFGWEARWVIDGFSHEVFGLNFKLWSANNWRSMTAGPAARRTPRPGSGPSP